MRKEQILIPLIRQIVNRPKLATAFGRLDRWGNPYTDEVLDDPMTLAEPMRADGPVYRHPLYQQWFVMGYDEARTVLSSPDVGTQNQMDVMLDVRPYSKLHPDSRAFLRNLMLLTDPPIHTRLRALVNRAFTPRQVSRLEPRMNALVETLLSDFGPEVEVMNEFAVPFPAMVITELVGFEAQEWIWLRRLAESLTKFTDPVRAFDPQELDAGIAELRDRVRELAAERRANPTDDLLTGLALAEADGDRLSEAELVSMIGLILVAGHETTSATIGLAMLLLREHPDQLEMLRNDPGLWPNAIEEIMRMDPTFRAVPRSALTDIELGGKHIKRNENIVVMTQLANRDPRRMSDPDDFRVDREDPSPISFGHGIHYCLGASLARAELLAALPLLVEALEGYSLDRRDVVWRESLTLRGPAVMPFHR